MIRYVADVRPFMSGRQDRDVVAEHDGPLPGCLDRYGNVLYAGTWVVHSMASGGIQLTRIEAIEPPVRPDVMDAIIKVRTPRRTWDRVNQRHTTATLGPVRQVGHYGVVRYLGKLPDEYRHLA